MSMSDQDDVHISLPPTIFAGLVLSAFLGGGGLYGVFGPQLDKAAIAQCIDNSDVAIDVAAQHGREIQILRELILERTEDRYTRDDARDDWEEQRRRDATQDRRLDFHDIQIEEERK